MRVLITGATGFIGQEVAQAASREGHEIIVLTRNPDQARLPYRLYGWDAEHRAPPEESLQGIDAVIHLAGEPVAKKRWDEEQKRRIRDSRVLGTRNLFRAFNAPYPSVFISASAIGYYGERGDEVLTETSAPGTDYLASVCKDWERDAIESLPSGSRGVRLRIGVVLGEKGGALGKMLPLFRRGLGGPLGSGSQWMSWIHRTDLVAMILEAMKNPGWNGVFNAVAPEAVTNKVFTHTLGRSLGRPAILPAPRFALRIALGEMSDALLASQRVLPEKVQTKKFVYQYSRLEDALKGTGALLA